MRSLAALAACAALAGAQTIDMDMILSAVPIHTPSIPVVYITAAAPTTTASATIVFYVETQALAWVSSAVVAGSTGIAKRDATSVTCIAQPTGIPHNSSPDTASAFLADEYHASVASVAPNLLDIWAFTLLPSYEVELCLQKCDDIEDCLSFNLYFERDPSVNPDSASCSNPSSYAQIKCMFWGGAVLTSNALNDGQWCNEFGVVIAGSNGYVNQTITPAQGYDEPTDLSDATINAPLDCSDRDTF